MYRLTPEQLERRADPGELRDHQPGVGQQHAEQRHPGQPQAELLPDQRGQALAGVGAQPDRHLLHQHQRDRDQHHEEQGPVDELGTRRGVGGDTGRVVAGVGRDQPGPGDGQDQPDPAAAGTADQRGGVPAQRGPAEPGRDGASPAALVRAGRFVLGGVTSSGRVTAAASGSAAARARAPARPARRRTGSGPAAWPSSSTTSSDERRVSTIWSATVVQVGVRARQGHRRVVRGRSGRRAAVAGVLTSRSNSGASPTSRPSSSRPPPSRSRSGAGQLGQPLADLADRLVRPAQPARWS